MSGEPASPIGPGRLVLVVGPSGAGKDTLLRLARDACADDDRILFPQRAVTREASAAEDNLFVSSDAFRTTQRDGGFALHWEAHGHLYGVPRAIDDAIAAGCTVAVNVSRTVVAQARRRYAKVTVVAVTAPPDVLAERLAQRSRSSDGPAKARLARAVDTSDVAPDLTIENVGDADEGAARLAAILLRID
jgi:ribose 1,5-bisphosphokinase